MKTDDIIDENEMVDILYDLHLAKSMKGMDYYSADGDTIEYTSEEFYKSILDKYQIEDSVLAKSIVYYSAYPKVYEKIYEQVVDKFNINKDELSKKDMLSIEGVDQE